MKVIDWNIFNNLIWHISFTLKNPTLLLRIWYLHNLSQPFSVYVNSTKSLKLCPCGDSTPNTSPSRGTDFISGSPAFPRIYHCNSLQNLILKSNYPKPRSFCFDKFKFFYFGFDWPVRLSGCCDICFGKKKTKTKKQQWMFALLYLSASKSSVLIKVSEICD